MVSSEGTTEIPRKGNFRINVYVCIALQQGQEVAGTVKIPQTSKSFIFNLSVLEAESK